MHPLLHQYQSTLLGRLKAHELRKLSGSEDILPSQRDFFREVFRLWKSNPMAGRFYFNLLDCWRVDRVEFPAKFPGENVEKLLEKLNRKECFNRIYAEGRALGEKGSPQVACLILGHRRETNEPGYYAAVYADADSERCFFCSLVPDGTKGTGKAAVLTSEGWKDVSSEDVTSCMPLRVMMATFSYHLENRADPKLMPIKELKQDAAYEPPIDDELTLRLNVVLNGKMTVTAAITSLKNIIPKCMDFCFRFSATSLLPLVSRIQSGYRPAILVYWNGSKFVMSDDYPDYLAYRQADCEDVPVAILGDFPPDVAVVAKCGGPELLPPIGLGLDAVYPAPISPEFREWQLEEKFRSNCRNKIPSDLIAVWMGFADLLFDGDVDERELHEFILKHPEVLTAYGTRIDSEIRLGNRYRIDIAVVSRGIRDEVTLVELEHHRHDMFTRDGQTRAEITHAVQQVQDWFRWLRENPTDEFAKSLRGIPPKGLVVVGRSRDFTEEHRSRLAHLNEKSAVQIITYDELLERYRDLILNRIDDSKS